MNKMALLILKEILHRKYNFLLSLSAVVMAVTLFVLFLTTGEASQRETVRLMRDLGYNLRIISKKTDMEKFYAAGFSEHLMPEEYVYSFAEQDGVSFNHLLAMLQEKIQWKGKEVRLIGIASEISPPGKKKSPMIFSIKPGTLYLGFEIARALGIQSGDEVDLLGESFRVENCLSETGSEDDISVYAFLNDVQRLVNRKDQINEIKALECLCRDPQKDSLTLLRTQLEDILPEAKVIQSKRIASAREKQRIMMEKYFSRTSPFILVVCAVWIGALAMMNVRERRQETGILQALGYPSQSIAGLYLGKAVIIGVIGAILGFAMGTALALALGPQIFTVTAKAMKPAYGVIPWTLMAAPLFAALSSLMPAMMAATQDPATTLREE